MTVVSCSLPCVVSRAAGTQVRVPTSKPATAPLCGRISRPRLSKGARNKVGQGVVLAAHLPDVPQARFEVSSFSVTPQLPRSMFVKLILWVELSYSWRTSGAIHGHSWNLPNMQPPKVSSV
jgi:hypothetical protein